MAIIWGQFYKWSFLLSSCLFVVEMVFSKRGEISVLVVLAVAALALGFSFLQGGEVLDALTGAAVTDSGLGAQGEISVGNADGLLVYVPDSPGTKFEYSLWNDTNKDFNSNRSDTQDFGNPIEWVLVEAAPTRDEFIMGGLTSTNPETCSIMVYDGTTDTWGDYSNIAPYCGNVNDKRPLSIAYEQSSGDALIVFEGQDNSAGTTFNYSSWNGSDYSTVESISHGLDAARLRWLMTFPKNNSDHIMVVGVTSLNDVFTTLWNGTDFGSTHNVTLTLSSDNRAAKFAWESLSGDGLLVYGENADNIDYQVYNASNESWDPAVRNATITGSETSKLWLASDPSSDDICIINYDVGADVSAFIWNGSTFDDGAPSEDTSVEIVGGLDNIDCNWNSTRGAIFTYIDTAAAEDHMLNYFTYDGETQSWSVSAITDASTSPTVDPDEGNLEYIRSYKRPGSDDFLYLAVDSGNDLNFIMYNSTGDWQTISASPVDSELEGGLNFASSDFAWSAYLEDPDAATSTSCGEVSSDLTLTSNVTSTGTCFTFTANNTVLDCDGHYINYSTTQDANGYGVDLDLYSNVTVRNCNIDQGATGANNPLRCVNGDSGVVESTAVTVLENIRHFYFSGCNDYVVRHNTFNSSTSIAFDWGGDGSRNRIENNTLIGSFNGNFIDGENNTILNNYFGSITDLSENTQLNEFIYNNSFGQINWTNETAGGFISAMDVGEVVGLGETFFIEENNITVDVSSLDSDGKRLDDSATLTFFNVTGNGTAYALKDGAVCGASCESIAQSGDDVLLNVSSFSSYSIAFDEGPYAEGNVTGFPASYNDTEEIEVNITWIGAAIPISTGDVLIETNFTGTPTNYTMTLVSGNGSDGDYNYTAGALAAGNYYWKSYANNTDGTLNSTDIQEFSIVRTESNATAYIDGSAANATVTVNEGADLSCNATTTQGTLTLYNNGTEINSGSGGIENNSVNFTVQGDYNITCDYAASENFTASSSELTLTAALPASSVNLTLNGANDNITIPNGTSATLNCTTITGDDSISLYNNGTLINDGLDSLQNETTFSLGYYNITCIHPENANYSEGRSVYWVNATDEDNAPTLGGGGGNAPGTYNASISKPFATINDDFGVVSVTFEFNLSADGSLSNHSANLTSGTNTSGTWQTEVIYPAGDFALNLYALDTGGNLFTFSTTAGPVAKEDSFNVMNLTLNESAANISINNDTSVNISCSSTTGESLLRSLTKDGETINLDTAASISNLTSFPVGGVYNITCNQPETENYTANSTEFFVTVTDDFSPTVTLNSPAASFENHSVSTTTDLTFNCSSTDEFTVANVSLYLSNGSNENFALNQTTSFSSGDVEANWTVVLEEGDYTWNCLATDNSSAETWGSSNRTLDLDYDADGDGVRDDVDSLSGNESDVDAEGVEDLNVSIGGAGVGGNITGEQEVTFYDGDEPLINFTFNFSDADFDLNNVTINSTNDSTGGSLIVNLGGQLPEGETKELYIDDNDFAALCVKDSEISSVVEISSACTGSSEINLDSCIGVSSGVTVSGVSCYDLGERFRISGLSYSGVLGETTARASSSSSSSSGSTGGGGGGGSGSSSVGVVGVSEIVEGEQHKEVWSGIPAGELASFALNDPAIAMTQVGFVAQEDLAEAWVLVELVEDFGEFLAPRNDLYQALHVSKGSKVGPTQVEEFILDFKVPLFWMTQMGAQAEEVILLHHDDEGNVWFAEQTYLVKTDRDFAHYQATVGDFSYFAIGLAEGEEAVAVVSEAFVDEPTNLAGGATFFPELWDQAKEKLGYFWLSVLGVCFLLFLFLFSVAGNMYYRRANSRSLRSRRSLGRRRR